MDRLNFLKSERKKVVIVGTILEPDPLVEGSDDDIHLV